MFEILVVPNRKALKLAKAGELAQACWVASYWESRFKRDFKHALRRKPLKVGVMLMLCYPDKVDLKEAKKAKLPIFDKAMAEKATAALDRAVAKGIKRFVFSCDAGISRSAGMAQAFEEWLRRQGLPCKVQHQNPPQPNPLVRRLCFKMLTRRRSHETFDDVFL